jgi:hypothetical protein
VVQLPGTLAIEHHIESSAILDASAGIEVFGLREDLDTGEFPRNSLQTQQGRVADGGEQRLGFGARQMRNR